MGLCSRHPTSVRTNLKLMGLSTNHGSYCPLMITKAPKPPVRLMECDMCAMAGDFIDGDANFV